MSQVSTPVQADSAYRSALLAAYGLDAPLDLRAALAHLQRAAESGHWQARMELAVLAGNGRLATEIIQSGNEIAPQDWQRLGAAIDVAAWRGIPAGRMLSEAPRIAAIGGFIPAPVCDWLILVSEPHLKRAEIFDTEKLGLREDRSRTNSAASLDIAQADVVLGFVRARIASLAEVPLEGLEVCQVLHYDVGEQFAPHYDFLDVSVPGHARDVEIRGQRALTLLVYLNEDYEGGETAFPLLGKSFKGRKGDALVFWNVLPDGAPDRRTLHAGTSPTKGAKWLLSQWIRVGARPSAG
jgi:prolyl 4-hydroxylase